MVWCGKAGCGAGWTLLGGAGLLREPVVLGSGGFAGDRVALGSTGVVPIADDVFEGACVVVGEFVGVADGAAVGAVGVTGIVGTTAPVGPTGSRDTTRTADTTMPTATTPMAPSAIILDAVLYQGSRRGALKRPEMS